MDKLLITFSADGMYKCITCNNGGRPWLVLYLLSKEDDSKRTYKATTKDASR